MSFQRNESLFNRKIKSPSLGTTTTSIEAPAADTTMNDDDDEYHISNNKNKIGDVEDGVIYSQGTNHNAAGVTATTTTNTKNINSPHSSDEDFDEQDGLMMMTNSDPDSRRHHLHHRRRNGGYASVPTNQSYPRRSNRCCGVTTTTICQTFFMLVTVVIAGWYGYHLGQTNPLRQPNRSSWLQPDSTSSRVVVSNMDSKTYSDLLKEANLVKSTAVHKQHVVRYNPSAALARDPANNPFAWDNGGTPNVVTPPRVNNHQEESSSSNIGSSVGYFTHPHLVNNQLIFCAEGDAYLTYIGNSGGDDDDTNNSDQHGPPGTTSAAMKLTTTIGNVLTPKWHPTLSILAYTATYSGRRDVYLLDLREGTSTGRQTPVRLTYWDVGYGGVSAVIGWISNNKSGDDDDGDNDSSYSLLFRAMSNEVSLPDYRLFMIHLDNNRHSGQASGGVTNAVMEIEPVPLAQAMDAARWNRCWYFVRYKQSSNTIRYVGGTAENMWRYCDNESSSQPLFVDDDYKGTSKDPQVYDHGSAGRTYLFFLSDRGHDGNTEKSWIPDRMNVWALPLKADHKAPLSTSDLIQITDTACDFEGRTVREYSVDAVTGNLVARIGADLYLMSQEAIHAKLEKSNKNKNDRVLDRRFMEELKEEDVDVKKELPTDDKVVANENSEQSQNKTSHTKQEEKIQDVPAKGKLNETVVHETDSPSTQPVVVVEEDSEDVMMAEKNVTDVENATEAPKYYYNYEPPEMVSRNAGNENSDDHVIGHSADLKHLRIKVYSDFYNLQERIVPISISKHFRFGDVFDTVSQTTKMLLTLRGQLWVAPVIQDTLPVYGESGQNLPARQYKIAPGAMMGGVTRILAARHVPNPAEDEESDRRLAVVLATDPLTTTAEHAFYLIEVQPGVDPLFVSFDELPKPFLGGMVSGGSTRDGGLGSVKVDTIAVSPCGNRMAWSDTDGRIVVMNLPQYQEQHGSGKSPDYVVLPQENELGEPMIGDEVELTFSPGGRYLAIEHHARNQFLVLSIADLGDPLREENKIAEIDVGRIVQATPSKFNSHSVFWGRTPTDSHNFARDQKMSDLFGLKDPDDVSTSLYFLSDRDILTDVHSPWGDRQKMPHFSDSQGVFAIPFTPKHSNATNNGQFRGGGAEEAQIKEVLDRKSLLQSLLGEVTPKSKRQRRKLEGSPLAGVFGFADTSFRSQEKNLGRHLQGSKGEDEEDYLREAVFNKDMDIDFGGVDLSFARRAYRLANIPEGNYVDILSQIPDDGSLLLVESPGAGHDYVLNVFLADDFPSDQFDSKKFSPTMRKLGAWALSTSRDYFYLIFAPDGATRVVPNTLSGLAKLFPDVELDDSVVDREDMHLSIWPSLEHRQMYDDAWRMLRDYFYDPDMTGIDWPAIHERYLPLVERCTKREELDDVLIQMASELSALHVFVYGGEYNSPTHGDKDLANANDVGSLGAVLRRSPEWNGYMVMSVPMADPDFTRIDQESTVYSPLCDQTLRMSGQRGLQIGDVIVGVNGESVMRVPDIHMLLRGTAKKSVRLDVMRLASGLSNRTFEGDIVGFDERDEAPVEPLVVVPLSPESAEDLLYRSWEWRTEQLAQQLAAKAGISVGYVHLQDMSGPEAEDAFARGFFPNYHKQGFILDVRHNRGGNIDSWILDVLQRRPWMYWQARAFNPSNGGLGWDEHFAFRGHIVVLLDEKTSSDGEGVSRGISELGLGKLIGTRTWGGGIWLASDNHLVDGGIATAPEIGTYNEHLEWGLHIEQMGVDPDILVDNDPHETFSGKDRQLERAIEELKTWLDQEPVVLPKPPQNKKDMTMGGRECSA